MEKKVVAKPEKPATAPTVTVPKSSVEVQEDRRLELIANVTGKPKPKVTWTKGGSPIKDSPRIKIIESASGECALKIAKSESGDSGTYTVIVENTEGDAATEIALVVLSKPDAPEQLALEDVTDTSVKLVWGEPRKTGGHPIKRYTVEKRQSGKTTWTKLTTTKETTFTIKRATSDTTDYDVRVTAETDQGEGPASEAVTVRPAVKPDQKPDRKTTRPSDQ